MGILNFFKNKKYERSVLIGKANEFYLGEEFPKVLDKLNTEISDKSNFAKIERVIFYVDPQKLCSVKNSTWKKTIPKLLSLSSFEEDVSKIEISIWLPTKEYPEMFVNFKIKRNMVYVHFAEKINKSGKKQFEKIYNEILVSLKPREVYKCVTKWYINMGIYTDCIEAYVISTDESMKLDQDGKQWDIIKTEFQ